MNLSDFDYHLPERLIAQHPAVRRDASRLMVLGPSGGSLHTTFDRLPDHLRPGDLLVFNETKVFPARLMAQRESGGEVELLLVRPAANGCWEAMGRNVSRLKGGERLAVGDGVVRYVGRTDDGLLRVEFRSDREAMAVCERYGKIPLPPYIRREGGAGDAGDRERYQTIFARQAGSCAAPTAGLHFTPELMERLDAAGVRRGLLTLHVGPGTFRPVTAERVEEHRMDREWYEIPAATADAVAAARREGGRVIAVGSTVARALEASARHYGEVREETGETALFVTPGYPFRVIDGMVTNLHLPKSTLFMLVCALMGRERMQAAYAEAVAEEYRFFSYGDAMLLLRGAEAPEEGEPSGENVSLLVPGEPGAGVGGGGGDQVADPAEGAAAADPEAGGDDEPEEGAPELPVVDLPGAGDEKA